MLRLGSLLLPWLAALAPGLAAEPAASVPAARVAALIGQLDAPATRNGAREAIVAMGSEATPHLLPHMHSGSFTVRWELANVQGDIRDPRALPDLADNVLRDADPHVRWRSIWAINEYPDRSPALALLRTAMASADPGVRWNAAVGVSMMDGRDALPVLHAGLADPDGWRRWEAVNALGRIHDETTSERVGRFLVGADVRERGEAMLSLGSIGDVAARRLLVLSLQDPEAGVRWRAAMSLADIGAVEAVDALLAREAVEGDPLVLEHVATALRKLAPGRAGAPQR